MPGWMEREREKDFFLVNDLLSPSHAFEFSRLLMVAAEKEVT